MIEKQCPFCNNRSYSSYDDPNWICPYCGRNIGYAQSDLNKQQNPLGNKVIKLTKKDNPE